MGIAEKIAPSLETAQHHARRGDWHALLGLQSSSSAADIRKARRRLQLSCHSDKGGDPVLSQLINHAADILLEQCPEVWAHRAQMRAQEEAEELLRAEQERRQAEEERRQRVEEYFQTLEARRQKAEQRNQKQAVQRTSARGARRRTSVYLSKSTSRVFPVCLRMKINTLQQGRNHAKARCVAYAAESEISARRAARETKFPRTCGLEARDPAKAQELARIKPQYERAYQRLCYVRRTRQYERCASLAVARLLREAWDVLLSQPAPFSGDSPIPLGLD